MALECKDPAWADLGSLVFLLYLDLDRVPVVSLVALEVAVLHQQDHSLDLSKVQLDPAQHPQGPLII